MQVRRSLSAGTRAPLPQAPQAALSPEALCASARLHVEAMNAFCERAISRKVDELAQKLIRKGLVKVNDEGSYEPGEPARRSTFERARDVPARVRRRAEFNLRRRLNRPRTEGSQAFRGGGDQRTFTPGAWTNLSVAWTKTALFRTGLSAASSPGGHGYQPPPGVLEGLGVASGFTGGFSLLDGLDMFNSYLDAVAEQDRWKVEVVVFYAHFQQYFADREAGRPSTPEVVHGFRRCQAGLSRCGVFDKAARQGVKRYLAGALKDTGFGSLGTLMGSANTGLRIFGGGHAVVDGALLAGTALSGANLPLSWICAGIDGWMGASEFSDRKKAYRYHKACCRQIQAQIDALTVAAETPSRVGEVVDRGARMALVDLLQGAQKRHRRLKKQARYDMAFGGMRVAKAALNGVAGPVAAAALAGAAAATGPTAAALGATAGTAYLVGCSARAVAQHELRSRIRGEQYDATTLAATVRPEDRTARLAQAEPLLMAGTHGYWVGGRTGFAGGHVHEVDPETHAMAALDEFAALVAGRPAGGPHPDALVEQHLLALLATARIDERLFNDIEGMVRARSAEWERVGAHPRDLAWQALIARREQYAAVFGLQPAAPKLPIGALLPSFQLARGTVRLAGVDDDRAATWAGLLEAHQNGWQLTLREIDEHLMAGHPRDAERKALTATQKEALAERLFHSMPPTLFVEQTNALLEAIDTQVGDSQAFEWQADNPMLRDLRAFRDFVQAQWLPAQQALSRLCANAPADAFSLKGCATADLSTAMRYLASDASTLAPSALEVMDRAEWRLALAAEWNARLAVDDERRACAALAEHCATHPRYAGKAWSRDAKGNFHCALDSRGVALIPAAALAKWIRRQDWREPLPIERRSSAPAAAVRWLTTERGAAVDSRFIDEAGAAATLRDLQRALDESPHADEGARLQDLLLQRPGPEPLQAGDAPANPFQKIEKAMEPAGRIALTDVSARSTMPWAQLTRLQWSFGKPWQLEIDGEVTRHDTFAQAVQAHCDALGRDRVRAVFLTRPRTD